MLAAAALTTTGCATPAEPVNTLFSYAVSSHTCDATIPGATPKGHFCTITITVRNTTTAAHKPGIAFAKAQDTQGATYLADAIAQIRADGNGPSLLDDLAPKSEITSRLVYDLPKDRTITSVVLPESGETIKLA
jgi:hypothetical protein